LCGDKIKLTVEGDLTQIRAIKFKGQGCSVSQASASMMCELCEKKSAKEIFELKKIFEGMILNRELSESEKLELLGDAKVLRSIQKFPARYRCALLAWNAVEECLAKIDVKIDSKNIDKSR
jgi:nitrogen fixation NifU-like protein